MMIPKYIFPIKKKLSIKFYPKLSKITGSLLSVFLSKVSGRLHFVTVMIATLDALT